MYMEHILDKVREHFKLGEDKALIDIEIFLSRLSAKKSRAGLSKWGDSLKWVLI